MQWDDVLAIPSSRAASSSWHDRTMTSGADFAVREKLRAAFRQYDSNDNGFIERDEIAACLRATLASSGIGASEVDIQSLAEALMKRADKNADGRLCFDEFVDIAAPFVTKESTALQDSLSTSDPLAYAETELRSRGPEWLLFTVYAAVNIALFINAWLRYEPSGLWMQLARGCGACLNLHGALVLLPMMRRAITALGRTALGRLLIDDHVGFHRIVGSAAFFFAIGHTVAHLFRFYNLDGTPWVGLGTWAGTTGLLLLITHLMLWAFAQPRVRRTPGRFELFSLVHLSYPLWLVLMLVHGPVAWMWMALPIGAFLIDRFVLRRIHRTRVGSLRALSAGVTSVRILRPPGFRHRSGDYVFVRVPKLSHTEWHPFTISSSPDERDVTLHVRACGDWTNALRHLAKRGVPDVSLRIDLDGPYGTATSQALEEAQILLVAGGIGVTPFAAILRELVSKKRNAPNERLPDVSFIWLCRERDAFAWFTELLREVEQVGAAHVAIHLSSARAAGEESLAVAALEAVREQTGADFLTGLRARTFLGAPDWNEWFCARAKLGKNPVCYFCGPDGLAEIVRSAAMRARVPFRQEHF